MILWTIDRYLILTYRFEPSGAEMVRIHVRQADCTDILHTDTRTDHAFVRRSWPDSRINKGAKCSSTQKRGVTAGAAGQDAHFQRHQPPFSFKAAAGAGCHRHIAMESNYDPDMQLASRRAQRIKDRIMGGHGHLSNQEAFEAVQDMFDLTAQRHGPDRRPRHVVLLHRSRQCNSPARIREAFGQDHRIHEVLTLAHQDQRTEWLSSGPRQPLPGEQLAMFSPVASPD